MADNKTHQEMEQRLRADFHAVFDTEPGRRVLHWLSRECHETEPCYVPDSFDGTAYNEGLRATILMIRAKLKT